MGYQDILFFQWPKDLKKKQLVRGSRNKAFIFKATFFFGILRNRIVSYGNQFTQFTEVEEYNNGRKSEIP